MIDVDVPVSSAIEPRMSVCLKGTQKLFEASELNELLELDELSLSDEGCSREFTVEDKIDGGHTITCEPSTRSALSSSSILLTGTSHSILRTSPVFDSTRRHEKMKLKANGIRFSESVHVRNHIHHAEITSNEKVAAWFRKPEYKAIFKNNTQIIHTVEKREKEAKRMKSRKDKENKKKKNKRNSKCSIEDSCAACMNEMDISSSEGFREYIVEVHRDDERGFSVRGLENETAKKRRARDQTYLKARFAVLSVQEDVDEHMYSMQEQHEEKLAMIARGNKKKPKRRFSFNRLEPPPEELPEEEEIERIRKLTEATKEEFSVYAKSQYNNMIHLIAEKYSEICLQDSRDALERGQHDERAVRVIDWIESESGSASQLSLHSSLGKGMSDSSQEQDKRRPSTTSTCATEESVASLALLDSDEYKISRVKRAKMFLWKFV